MNKEHFMKFRMRYCLMKIFNSILILTCCLGLLGATSINLIEEHNFSISYPLTVDLEISDNGRDFVIYTFLDNHEILLRLYIGNAPNFPAFLGNDEIKLTALRDFKVYKFSQNDMTMDRISEEGLIQIRSSKFPDNFQQLYDQAEDKESFMSEYLKNKIGWPEYIHYWYSDKTESEVVLINSILESIAVPERLSHTE